MGSICSDNLIFTIEALTEINVEKDMQAQTKTQCFSYGLPVLLAVFTLEPSQLREEISHNDGVKSMSSAGYIKGKVTVSKT